MQISMVLVGFLCGGTAAPFHTGPSQAARDRAGRTRDTSCTKELEPPGPPFVFSLKL